MERSFARVAVVVLLLLFCTSAFGAEMVVTHCEESTLALDSTHEVSRLGRCSESEGDNLLWHLDRLDQVGGSLDGHFIRRNRGAGVVVYVMDTGVLATHDEFAGDNNSSRVIGGFDVAATVPLELIVRMPLPVFSV